MKRSITRVPKPTRATVRVQALILSVVIEPECMMVSEILPRVGARHLEPTDADKVLEIDRWEIDCDGIEAEVAIGYINGMGNAKSALETLIYLQRTSPKFVFLCGISGTLDPDVAGLGDVVIAKSVQWWKLNKLTKDAKKIEAERTIKKYLQLGAHFFRKDISTVGQLNNHWNKRLTSFSAKHKALLRSDTDASLRRKKSELPGGDRRNVLHYDKVVSWDYVLSDETVRKLIREDPEGGLAIEMEGAGFLSSIDRCNEEVNAIQVHTGTELPGDTVGFIFRGVTDVCHNKGAEPQEWRSIAMSNAASKLVDFLRTFSEVDFLN